MTPKEKVLRSINELLILKEIQEGLQAAMDGLNEIDKFVPEALFKEFRHIENRIQDHATSNITADDLRKAVE